eukprot:COSAG01_NODE_2551_length_7464_cov_3.080652_2_plen_99_part_00
MEDLDDLDEALDEILGEGKDDLTEEGAARLKEALRALQSACSPATSHARAAQPWEELCSSLQLVVQPAAALLPSPSRSRSLRRPQHESSGCDAVMPIT